MRTAKLPAGARSRRSFLRLLPLLAAVLLFLSGCGRAVPETDNNCGNNVMGNGTFLMEGDLVYFTDKEFLYRYDLETEETLIAPAEGVLGQMNLLGDQILYLKDRTEALYAVNVQGSRPTLFYESAEDRPIAQVFIAGNACYYLTGFGDELMLVDLKSNEERVLCSRVRSFYADEDGLYAVRLPEDLSPSNVKTELWVSKGADGVLAPLPLEFSPISVLRASRGEEKVFYLNRVGDYTLFTVSEEGRTLCEYPIHTLYYQVLNDVLYYLDQDTFEGDYRLMTCDLTTGEKTVLAEQVFDFCILGDRYLGICQLFSNTYLLYDTETGRMLDITKKTNN